MDLEYVVDGMTCSSCEDTVNQSLSAIPEVRHVNANKLTGKVKISASSKVPIESLQDVLPKKYTISIPTDRLRVIQQQSKWRQLTPLFLVLGAILMISVILNIRSFRMSHFMFDFMGVFLLTFSAFKFIDYRGFPKSFTMYDPLAKRLNIYAWMYPFLELLLGFAFLTRFQLKWTIGITLLILSITTMGVIQSLRNKNQIQCACLGTALKLPMTEATLIENVIMIGMGLVALFMI